MIRFWRRILSFVGRNRLPVTAYRAILRREPTSAELARKERASLRPEAQFSLLRDMVASDEFRVQILPSLVVTSTKFRSGHPVFFLHVPKTGGTSVRLALSEALGVPSINVYQAWPKPDSSHAFWPLWAGHANIGFFPDSHQGFTVFREARSRVLSRYRQQQFRREVGRKHGWEYPSKRFLPNPALPDFDTWVHSLEAPSVHWFIPHPDRSERRWGYEEAMQLSNQPKADLRKHIAGSLSRFISAGWLHDEQSVLEAIRKVAGRAPEKLASENTARDKGLGFSIDFPPVEISETALARINWIAEIDQLVIEQAVARGLIQGLSPEESEREFHKTAARLKFRLPID